MQSELILKFEFEASHSLENYEEPHFHLWKLEIAVGGQVVSGKIVDMMEVRNQVERIIDELKATYLNENPSVGDAVRKAPTCETLGQFFSVRLRDVLDNEFSEENPSIHLISVMVTICTMDATEIGGVRLSMAHDGLSKEDFAKLGNFALN
jgi:6-pyruvoyl-tetrahydropterin synthase